MSTLEDKILGEKLQYYCSSSEDEGQDNSANSDKESEPIKSPMLSTQDTTRDFSDWDGTSSNTGPKGVIKVFL